MDTTDHFYTVQPKDAPPELQEIGKLLAASDLDLDSQIEVFVVCRRQGRLVACAGLDHSTIKCVAVAEDARGESLSLRLGGEVVNLAAARGQFHLFLYTAPRNLPFFRGWGFYPVVEVPQRVVVMENSPVAIERYCDSLRAQRRPGTRVGGIVLNANPFTLGHRYLVEHAARACDWLHVFVVKEDASSFSYADRFALVAAGVQGIDNLTLHPGSDYIISRATFPAYFLKDQALVERSWAAIDLLLFREYIAPALGITHRYVGTEPFDRVTNSYNTQMKQWLEDAASVAPPIGVVETPRASVGGVPISATEVRRLLAQRDFGRIAALVPATTLQFLEKRFPAAASATSIGRANGMKVIKEAVAGTLESSDLLVKVAPGANGTRDIAIRSEVIKQFGKQIRRVVTDTLDALSITEAAIAIEDKGALDCVIRARVQAALLRACAPEDLDWEKLS
ncbi:MAG TPA: [citrate (pro-3S)-lyase] ligase [Candidatus Eisenbacteria bacterium]|nr:[citrate (pro-3S)-lyase] ligase [Candidatus Eisenbacteria bacterium]